VFRTRSELADLYAIADPTASRGAVSRLLQGSENELVDMDRATEELAALAASTPAVREALRSGTRGLDELDGVEGGPAFVAGVNAALATHGHLGQLADDLETPSFGEQPERYATEIAKRLDRPAGPGAEERRRRLRAEADELVERARRALADNPETLARFDAALTLARRIGPLSEGHNYWIDRAVLAHLRRLVMRVGARLVREGVLERPDDVFYLRRAEVPDLLREPRSQRAIVNRRREEHEADSRLSPASNVGGSRTTPDDHPRFTAPEPTTQDAGVHGMGASAGVARGPARIVLDVDGFARVQPGDIIVCRSSNPSFVPIFSIAAGLITNVGGLLSHAAVVAREFGLPAVVGVADATTRIADGKIVVYELLSLDGVAESPDEFIEDWDDAMDANLAAVIGPQDDVILGRRSYEEWARFWPQAEIEPFATFINGVTKHVATSSPLDPAWANSHVIDGDVIEFARRLKEGQGGDIGVHASISVAQALLAAGLVDELRLVVAPSTKDGGKRLLEGLPRLRWELAHSQVSPKGYLLLDYRARP
jgi:phosphohistidine swiveling domain-containing protein/dihydrofolate reductase